MVMVETDKYCYSGSRWSRAVTHFETVTCPRKSEDQYMDDLVRIAEKYNVDFFVPVSSPVSAIPDANVKPRLKELGCKVLHFAKFYFRIYLIMKLIILVVVHTVKKKNSSHQFS